MNEDWFRYAFEAFIVSVLENGGVELGGTRFISI